MSALDYSHFKKISQDKNSAVLLHPDGHKLKIAIGSLNPALKKKLEALPLHQAEGSQEPVEAMDEDSSEAPMEQAVVQGAPIEVNAAPPPPAQEASAPAPAPQQVNPALEPQAAPVGTPPHPDMVPSSPEAPAPQKPMPVAPPTPEQEALESTKQDILVGQDLSNGHIQPKTYRDLYNSKDTLGKVGTLFGLLLAGAGSGLNHQPNAVMEMMDKQIQNDLEAQKTDQSNKQNWFKLSLEHTKNQATNALTNSEAYKNATEADKQHMLNQALGVAESEATVRALNVGRLGALQDQQNSINKMPLGPQRDSAQGMLNGMIAANQTQMFKDNLAVANQKKQSTDMLSAGGTKEQFNPPPEKGAADPNKKYSAVNTEKLQKAINLGKLAPEVPGAIPPGDRQVVLNEQKDLENHRDTWANAEKAFGILDQVKNSGQIPAAGTLTAIGSLLGSAAGSAAGPLGISMGGSAGAGAGQAATHSAKDFYERLRSTVMDSLIGQLDKNKSYEERKRIAESMMPSWTDDSKSRLQAHKELQQQFSADPREKATNLRLYGLKAPEPKYNYSVGKINSTKEDVSKVAENVGNSGATIAEALKKYGKDAYDAVAEEEKKYQQEKLEKKAKK